MKNTKDSRIERPREMAAEWLGIITGSIEVSLGERIFFTLALPLMPVCFLGWWLAELSSGD